MPFQAHTRCEDKLNSNEVTLSSPPQKNSKEKNNINTEGSLLDFNSRIDGFDTVLEVIVGDRINQTSTEGNAISNENQRYEIIKKGTSNVSTTI